MSNHVRIADGYSSNKLAAVINTTPSGNEYALVVRMIGDVVVTGGGTSSLFMNAFPPAGTAAGFNDGSEMQAAMVYNTNLGGSEYTLGVNLRGVGPTGSFELGTQDHPLFIEDAAINTYQHISAPNTTIVLSNTPGVLARVLVTNFGATGATTVLYDNTTPSGTIIARINTSAVIGEIPFDISYDIGLTVVTDAKTPGDITIIYK